VGAAHSAAPKFLGLPLEQPSDDGAEEFARERGRSGAFLAARAQRAGRAASVTPSRPATTPPAPLRGSFAKKQPGPRPGRAGDHDGGGSVQGSPGEMTVAPKRFAFALVWVITTCRHGRSS
jgi:hypothetical protein